MAMGHERTKPLHNFAMPCLKWGNQKVLRCLKLNPNGEVSAAADRRSSAPEIERDFKNGPIRRRSDFHRNSHSPSPAVGVNGFDRKSEVIGEGDDGIEAIRAKLMFDLQTAADKMKVAILREGLEEESPPPPPAAPADVEDLKPWNLRTRRAASIAPSDNGGGAKSSKVDDRKPNLSPARSESKSPRSRGVMIGDTSTPSVVMKEREKFSVPLSRREIEEDFREIAGLRPPRRPKKRAKIVQRQLDSLFPGLWLMEINADSYRVPDGPGCG